MKVKCKWCRGKGTLRGREKKINYYYKEWENSFPKYYEWSKCYYCNGTGYIYKKEKNIEFQEGKKINTSATSTPTASPPKPLTKSQKWTSIILGFIGAVIGFGLGEGSGGGEYIFAVFGGVIGFFAMDLIRFTLNTLWLVLKVALVIGFIYIIIQIIQSAS